MKTTVELPDPLYRQAKATAALRGLRLKDLVEAGLRLILEAPPDARHHSDLSRLMKQAIGVIESGDPTLVQIPSTSRALGAMRAIVDTGPLVACFDRSERHHLWAAARVEELDAPLLVCEAVLTEAIYLLAHFPKAQDALFGLLRNGALVVALRLDDHIGTLHRLLRKYRDTPMSLADACVVRMAEIHDNHSVLTLDSDFSVYRKHGRIPIPLMHPAMVTD